MILGKGAIHMDDDLLTLLRTSKIFSSLTKRTLKKLAGKFEKIELNQDDILYYQGDPSDSIEILLEGRLISIITTATGEKKVAGHMDPGETVGELGALSGEPRATTIKAVKNSVLFKLPSEVFVELCHQYPSVLFAIINPIVSRSQQLIQILSTEKFKKHVVILPANDEVSLAKLSEKFAKVLEGLISIIVLSDFDPKLEKTSKEQIEIILEEAKKRNVKKLKQKFIYILKNYTSNLAKFCFDRAEMIYIVADDSAPILLDDFVDARINQFTAETKLKPELIMLHDEHLELPRNSISWLKLADFGLHHHIRLDVSRDLHRLLRFIRGKAVGLVLSGGGTRGFGHVGAIKALLEAGIPIDAIGGTSVGAIIAASYAMTESYEGTFAQFREIIEGSRRSVSWRNLTWPAISLFNARGLTNILDKVFNKVQIEDLWLPFFCVSTNLAKNSESIHDQGLLWEKLRASVSIPGIIPPMLLNGELHLDGGLLNNLPVDVMRKIIGHRGNIIAVELTSSARDEQKYNFPPILMFGQAFLAKLGIGYDYKFPRFIDTFLKSFLVGSSLKSQLNGVAANILIGIDLSTFPMLYSNKHQENKIVELGYETTMEKLKNRKRIAY